MICFYSPTSSKFLLRIQVSIKVVLNLRSFVCLKVILGTLLYICGHQPLDKEQGISNEICCRLGLDVAVCNKSQSNRGFNTQGLLYCMKVAPCWCGCSRNSLRTQAPSIFMLCCMKLLSSRSPHGPRRPLERQFFYISVGFISGNWLQWFQESHPDSTTPLRPKRKRGRAERSVLWLSQRPLGNLLGSLQFASLCTSLART